MSPLYEHVLAAGAASASILAAAGLATIGHPATAPGPAAPPTLALQCQLDTLPGGRATLRLTNTGVLPLARGTRYAWSTLGTPNAQGGQNELQRPLARGESETAARVLHAGGSGCVAVAVG